MESFHQWLKNLPPPAMLSVFVYGTLRHDEVRSALGSEPAVKLSNKDTLKGWKKVCGTLELEKLKDKKNYCTIVKSPASSVKGKVLVLTSDEIHKTDKWETNYNRQIVTLASGRKAYAYVMKDSALTHLKT